MAAGSVVRRRLGAIPLSFALLLCAPSPGSAQFAAGNTAGADNEPMQIQADSGIEWQQNARVYIARGNAVATRGTSEVRADVLIAYYRETKGTGGAPQPATSGNLAGSGNIGGNTEIYRVEAQGNVTLKRDTNTVVGDKAVYDVDQAIAVITGKSIKLTTATDFVTAHDSLEWYDQRQIAVARGDAVASRNGKTIKADILTAHMQKTPPAKPGTPAAKPAAPAAKPGKPGITPAAAGSTVPGKPPGDSKISRVDAQGHVIVTNGVDTGRGDFGVYNGETGIATLIGNVVLQRGNNVLRGQRGVMDLNTNVSRMLPGGVPSGHPGESRQRVQGLFIRDESTRGAPPGGGAHKPAPAAAAPGDKHP